MTTGLDELDNRIRDLTALQKQCDGLFEEVKKGKGEESLHYLALRDSCKQMRMEIIQSGLSAGLTRDRIKKEMAEAKRL
jgi:hypothetical protein